MTTPVAEVEQRVTHDTLVEALYALQQEVGPLSRDSDNPYYSSKFASFPAIRAKVDPLAWKHGLFVKQAVHFDGEADVLMNTLFFNGTAAEATNVRMHLNGTTPQAHGSAITFYRRYAYTTCLGLVSEQDDDGNAASVPVATSRESRPAPVPPRAAAGAAPRPQGKGELDNDF